MGSDNLARAAKLMGVILLLAIVIFSFLWMAQFTQPVRDGGSAGEQEEIFSVDLISDLVVSPGGEAMALVVQTPGEIKWSVTKAPHIEWERLNRTVWVHWFEEQKWVKLNTEKGSVDSLSLPAWAPDGKQICFVRVEYENKDYDWEIWVGNTRDGSCGRVSEGYLGTVATWTSSGSWIVFVARRNEESPKKLWAIRPDGTSKRVLIDSEDLKSWGSWGVISEDRIIYSPEKADCINVITVESGKAERLFDGFELGHLTILSPTGDRYIFFDEVSDSYYLVPNGKDPRQLFGEDIDSKMIFNLKWFPGGDKVLFTKHQDNFNKVCVLNVRTGKLYSVMHAPELPAVVPLGDRQLLCNDGSSVWIVNIDGEHKRSLSFPKKIQSRINSISSSETSR
ncbi:MAG: PD40 domain-containing protein [Planctomycetes bacterium]|nr:PD40 domain-containing protein [Planctomycetota bacterium]